MGEITHTRYTELLRRVMALEGPLALTFLEEVFPVLQIEAGLSEELDLVRGWQRGHAACDEPAGGAGSFNRHRFRNPAGSGRVCVVERLWFSALAANTLMFEGLIRSPASADLANGADQSSNLDSRVSPTGLTGGLTVSSGPVGAALSGGIILGVDSARGVSSTVFPLVMFPDSSCTFRSTIANVETNLMVQFRHRVAEPAELTV